MKSKSPRHVVSCVATASRSVVGDDGAMDSIEIRGDVIRLGQFLKLAGVVDAGAHAKDLLAEQRVRVNGEVENRRGRQLSRGDVVVIDEAEFTVA